MTFTATIFQLLSLCECLTRATTKVLDPGLDFVILQKTSRWALTNIMIGLLYLLETAYFTPEQNIIHQ